MKHVQRVAVPYLPGQPCSVHGCGAPAGVTVVLVDRAADGTLHSEQDLSCPFLCYAHQRADAAAALYTNRYQARGRTEYLPVETARSARRRGAA